MKKHILIQAFFIFLGINSFIFFLSIYSFIEKVFFNDLQGSKLNIKKQELNELK